MHCKINTNIETDEICVRCLTTPMHYDSKKNKLNIITFLPPKNTSSVSLLRLKYTTNEFCESHGRNLNAGKNTYIGLAYITPQILNKALESFYSEYEINDIAAKIEGTPINENGEYRTDLDNVFSDDLGLPMHADLIYSKAYNAEAGEVRTNIRIIAQNIVNLVSVELSNESEIDR